MRRPVGELVTVSSARAADLFVASRAQLSLLS